MKTFVSALLLLLNMVTLAQSDKDMIIASWKCVAVEQAPTQPKAKKQKEATPQTYAPNVDTLRKTYIGVVFGFLKNGTVAYNVNGQYDTRQYKVEGRTLIITGEVYIHTLQIVDINYRTMTWQDKNGVIYRFERE